MAVLEAERLQELLRRVQGLRAALLLDPTSAVPLARAARDAVDDLLLVAVRAARLLDAVRHGGDDPPAEVVLEAERASLVLLALPQGTLCLILDAGASPARAAFEARRALARRTA